MTIDVAEHDAAGSQPSVTRRRGERLAQSGSVAGAIGAALTSAAAALCCIGPLALTLLGVNGMILAAGLKPYQVLPGRRRGTSLGAGLLDSLPPQPVSSGFCGMPCSETRHGTAHQGGTLADSRDLARLFHPAILR